MNEYMVTIDFFSSSSLEFAALIPAQRAKINDLMEKGIVTSYSLSLDRQLLWMTLYTESYQKAKELIGSLPLSNFMRYDIKELMFHNGSLQASIKLSLN